MGRPQKYTAEFKEAAVAMVEDNPEITKSAIAEKLGIRVQLLCKWVAKVRYEQETDPEILEMRAEVERLRKELVLAKKAQAREEEANAILKKVVAMFSKDE